MSTESSPIRTIDVPQTETSLVKPTEMVSFRELVPFTLQARKALNLMIASAWRHIGDHTIEHKIPVAELKFGQRSDERLDHTLQNLLGGSIEMKWKRDKKDYVRRAPLFAHVDRPVGDGYVHYQFSQTLVKVISSSTMYTRLEKGLMLHLSGKYSLSMWEMIESRRKLKYQQSVKFTVSEWREKLGVADRTLLKYSNFKQRCWLPAIAELNQLSSVRLEWEEIKRGRSVEMIEMMWIEKTPSEKLQASQEMKASKIGRAARRAGRVDTVVEE